MNYSHITRAVFQSRPNRFIACAEVNGRTEICHVKNTGRCRELLVPGAKLILEYHPDAVQKGRKTSYDVIAVYKKEAGINRESLLINLDSQAPNQAAWEWVCAGGLIPFLPEGTELSRIHRETVRGNSRFDLSFFLNGQQAFMEVKGVTLERNGIAAFPDAPTERGIKHLHELADAARQGIPCFLLLVIQMKGIVTFRPNMETHPEFGAALVRAEAAGVRILACDCLVTEDSMILDQPVPVDLSEAVTISG